MTFVGKLLVVLIFVMTIVFMSFTLMVYSSHQNWRKAVEDPNTGFKVRLEQARQENSRLEAKRQETLNQLALERAARAQAIAELEARSAGLEKQLATTDEQLRNLQIEHGKAVQTMETAQNQMSALRTEVDHLSQEVRRTRQDRDAQLALVGEMTNRLEEREGELSRAKEQNRQLVSRLAQAQLVLDRHDLSPDMPVDDLPPELDGVVTAVRHGLIEVSLGADDGLRRGHKLDVYSENGSYLGRLEVTQTSPDRSVGRLLPEFQQGVIRKDDRVATRLL
jgi:hypothetical protein